MKIKEKFIIISSMVCIVLSLAAVSFSIAWYAMYPVYKDITVSIGDSGLSVNSRIFTRSIKETSTGSGIYEPFWNNTTGKFNTKYHDDTQKGEGAFPDNINSNTAGEGVTNAGGVLTIDFPALTYDLFNPNNKTYTDGSSQVGYVDPNGGILDEETMSIDIRYLTFALFELNYTNGFFSNFLYADMSTTLGVTGTNVNETNLLDYKNMIEIRQANETEGHTKTKLHYLDPAKGSEADIFDKTILAKVDNYATPSTAITSTIGTTPGTKYCLTKAGYVTEVATLSKDQIEVKPNNSRNYYVKETNFYSHAQAFTLSFNPILFMKFFTSFNHTDTKLTLTLNINFHASGNVMTTSEVDKYAK